MENALIDVNDLRTMVEDAIDMTAESREWAEEARDYYDRHQFTADEIQKLTKRRQPITPINFMRRKVDAMVGIEQRGRTDPRALPRNPKSQKSSDSITKALVYVEDNTRFDHKCSLVFENEIIEGTAAAEIGVRFIGNDPEITVNRIRWEEFIYDPYSREKDFSDAAWLGCMKWMRVSDVKAMYAQSYEGDDLEDMLLASMSGNHGDTYEDRPSDGQVAGLSWGDKSKQRVRIVDLYHKEGGVWMHSVFTAGGLIMQGTSSYLDEHGAPVCPIEALSAYIDRENRRHGLLRDLLPLQDVVNKFVSKAMHNLNNRQTMGPKGAVGSLEAFNRWKNDPSGHLELNVEYAEDGIKPFEILPTNDQTAGLFQLFTQMRAEINEIGPNASLIGDHGKTQSGRAIMAKQQAGFASVAPVYDGLRDWKLRCYRAMYCRMRQFWTAPRWVRITDSSGVPEFLGLNIPKGFDFQRGAPVYENAIAEIDVDIVIDDVADVVTLQDEEFEQLQEMARNGIPVPPEMLIAASKVRNKQDIVKAIEERQAKAMQFKQAEMQQEAQKEMREMQLDAMKVSAEAQKDVADAKKTEVEAMRLAFGR